MPHKSRWGSYRMRSIKANVMSLRYLSMSMYAQQQGCDDTYINV